MNTILLVACCLLMRVGDATAMSEVSVTRTFRGVVHADTTVTAPATPQRLDLPELRRVDDPLARSSRPDREPRRDPFTAFGRSLVLPGWGQGSLGDEGGAFAYGAAFGVALVVAFGLIEVPFLDDEDFSRSIGFGLWGTTAALASVAAFREAERLNRENGYDLDDDVFDDARTRAPVMRLALIRRDF